MLEVARVGPGDTVYDLGAGDGRIVVAAAQRFGARAVGVELDNNRFAFASARIRDFGLEPRARMVHGDLLAIDLAPATVVALYQLPSVNDMLRPAFERQLRSGARVVTLDFPVQGWKPSNVLTTQLTDGSQHAIYLYLINEIRKDAATMAIPTDRTYGAATCWLELQGAPAGFLKSAEGGDATADVVTEEVDKDFVVRKHLGGVKHEDIKISFGTGMSSSLYDWISATMGRRDQVMNGAVVVADYNGKEISRLNFFNGTITEIGFPALDPDPKAQDPAYITLKIAPEYTRREAGTGLKVDILAAVPKKWLPANFSLKIDGLDLSGVRVNEIDALTITRHITSLQVGVLRESEKEPGYLEIPNLAITLSEVGSEPLRKWYEDFVIKGNNGSDMAKNGTLEYLDSNLKAVLFTLTFRGLGIFKLTPEKYERSDKPRRLRAEMYCEEIGFQYVASAVTGKRAGAGTAPVGAAGPTTAPAAGTYIASPVYVQQFTADKELKAQKEALSQDLIAAPLRLGRPLKFRS